MSVLPRDPRLSRTTCPECGVLANASTNTADGKFAAGQPKPGDMSLCIECGAILKFQTERDGLKLVPIEPFDDVPTALLQVKYEWLRMKGGA